MSHALVEVLQIMPFTNLVGRMDGWMDGKIMEKKNLRTFVIQVLISYVKEHAQFLSV